MFLRMKEIFYAIVGNLSFFESTGNIEGSNLGSNDRRVIEIMVGHFVHEGIVCSEELLNSSLQ